MPSVAPTPAHRTPTGVPRRGLGGAQRVLSLLLSVLLASATLALGLQAPSAAAGSGQLAVTMTPVDYLTGTPQSTASVGSHGGRVAYRVNYSCSTSACDDTRIQLSVPQADPHGLAVRSVQAYTGSPGTATFASGGGAVPLAKMSNTLLGYENFTPPTAGGTISGAKDAGQLVKVGNLASGASGNFLVVYDTADAAPTGAETRTRVNTAQFYPDGFQIKMSATATSPTAVAAVTADAAAVTWNSTLPPDGPALNKRIPASSGNSVKPDEDVTYEIAMSTGSLRGPDGGIAPSSGRLQGSPGYAAAGSYRVVEKLAAQALYVSSDHGGVYDAGTHSVTWELGSQANPEYFAAGGFGAAVFAGWVNEQAYRPRTVTVRYPATKFPDAVAGCDFTATVNTTTTVSVTYLDKDRTTRTDSRPLNHPVSCSRPFGLFRLQKDASGIGTGSGVREQAVPHQPVSGTGVNIHSWVITASNGGNVPGVAVIDDTFDQPDIKPSQIELGTAGGTIAWELDTGLTGTKVTTSGDRFVDAPPGTHFVKMKVTTAPIQPVNVKPSDTGWANSQVIVRYPLPHTTPLDVTRTNSARASITYPGVPEISGGPGVLASKTVKFVRTRTNFTAELDPPVVTGGGNPVLGTAVTFKMRGKTTEAPPVGGITGQYVFLAPQGWTITPGSATFGSATVPAAWQYEYATRTVGGVPRDVVVVSWPGTVDFGTNTTWPTLSVEAKPTSPAVSGTSGTATAWIGDSRHRWDDSQANYNLAVKDDGDVDGDSFADWYAAASRQLLVSGAQGVSVAKEICLPDLSAVDGCAWRDNSAGRVKVAPNGGIKYRITLTNSGSSPLTGVVAYDVLPHLGDTGITDLTAANPRGSTFAQTLTGVDTSTANVVVAFSGSTNPNRPEVHPGASGTTSDWGTPAGGAKALRVSVRGTMTAGQTESIVFTAGVPTSAAAGTVACNTVAVATAQTLPAEPPAVCAEVVFTDLEVTAPALPPVQQGRPVTIPFAVTDNGPTSGSNAKATVVVPAGMVVSGGDPTGWTCVSSTPDPLLPTTLTCVPVDTQGDPVDLPVGTPVALPIRVVPAAVSAGQCVTADLAGNLFEHLLSNNHAESCFAVAPATAGLSITKDDGLVGVRPGDELTYTLTVANTLVGESLVGATLVDVLPASLQFVSASDGGTALGQTVTWALPTLARVGQTGNGVVRTVRARVIGTPPATIANTATVSAPDPGFTGRTLAASADDVDQVRALKVTKTASPSNPQPGDKVTWTVVVENLGAGVFTTADPASFSDDLADVLDDAVWDAAVTSDTGADPVLSGSRLTWSGPLAGGAKATFTYSTTLPPTPTLTGDGEVANLVCVPPTLVAPGEQRCADAAFSLPRLSVTKSVNPATGSVVRAGDLLTYRLSFTNDGNGLAKVDHVDHLAGVLDDTDIQLEATSTVTTLTAVRTGAKLALSGGLAPRTSATVSYQVKVRADGQRGDEQIDNFLTSAGVAAPVIGSCRASSGTCTSNKVVPTPAPPSAPGEQTPPAKPAKPTPLPSTGSPFGLMVPFMAVAFMVLGGTLLARRRSAMKTEEI